MAEGVLSGVAANIISWAGAQAAEEIKLIFGAKGELRKLTETVSTIKAVLLDAEDQQYKNREVSVWLEKLSDILFDADDLLDGCHTEALRRQIMTKDKKAKKVRMFFSESKQLAFRLKMGHKIKAINERIAAIKDVKALHLQDRPIEGETRHKERDSTHSFVPSEEVIGRDNDKAEVIKRLMDTNVEGNVLPIVGIGGIGKTALAQLVFNDERIQEYFELKIWVCVSDHFEVKVIVEKILQCLTKEKPSVTEMEPLKTKLKEKIDTKRYLLVLDDVWNENPEKWSELKRLLKGGGEGSRILVTTRSRNVARMMFQGDPFNLEELGEEQSMDLFKKIAFPNGEWPDNQSIKEMGRKILRRKCFGIPLVVRAVGWLLYFKSSEMEWRNFVDNELSTIDDSNYNGILSILKLSYDRLSSNLKNCFAYCSLYPKDYEYDKTTIIEQWIAHGFVESSLANQCFEVGNVYFKNLLWGSFFQDPKYDSNGELIGCKMHDLMHDLATSLMVGSLITTPNKEEWKINRKTHHLSVCDSLDCPIKELISQCEKLMIRIRTFHCPSFEGEINCEVIFSSFKFLRVLNLSENFLEHVPNAIGKLKHLRYLDLSDNEEIKMLPRSLTRLVNLQFLNLSGCEKLIGLPRGIKNLVKLRHLDLDGCSKMTYLPHGLRKSTGLQWLKQFRSGLDSSLGTNASLSEFKELNKLGGSMIIWKLRHSKDVAIEYQAANIKEKIGLKSLVLHFSSCNEVHNNDVENESVLKGLQPHAKLMELVMDSCMSAKLPSWILSITDLMELRLYKCRNCRYLPHVNQLRLLKVLDLREMNALDYIFENGGSEYPSHSSNFFPSLSKIHFDKCPKLKGWWRDSSSEVDRDSGHYSEKADVTSIKGHCTLPSFPKLKYLDVSWCREIDLFGDEHGMFRHGLESLVSLTLCGFPNLLSLPLELQPVSTIQDVSISYCKNLTTVVESVLNWKSFKVLRIQECPSLTELPAGIERPAYQLKFVRGRPFLA